MRLLKIAFLAIFFFLWLIGSAQNELSDSVINLNEVVIVANRLEKFTIGNRIEKIDSTTLVHFQSHNLADLLTQRSLVSIKSYGLGSLAIPSIRGSGANHTAILWNGFNLQSPMNSQLDLALLPVNFIDDIQIHYGGSGALFGSGAVGGSIHLNSLTRFNLGTGMSFTSSIGSFNDFRQGLNIQLSKKNYSGTLRVFYHTADNDFIFENIAQYGSPIVKQDNAELKQYGFLQENCILINQRQKISVNLWYQYSDRNIPPSMTMKSSISSQEDETYRISSEWKRIGKILTLFVRSAYFDERFLYKDPTIILNSKSNSKSLINEIESKLTFGKNHLVNIGVNNTYNYAKADNYENAPEQNRNSLFLSYKIFNKSKSIKGIFSLRKELINNTFTPLTPSFGFDLKIFKFLNLRGNVSRNYRSPSFNDLYWVPGGNPDLRAESGWSEEISVKLEKKFIPLLVQFDVSVFNNNVYDWIIWLPDSKGLWTPENIAEVWSRGCDGNLKLSYKLKDLKIKLTGMYSYVLSTNEKDSKENLQVLHKQLIYVPIHEGISNISIEFKGFYINYGHSYTGKRFTTSDNTQYLKSYQLGNVSMGKKLILGKISFSLSSRINNIWNESYQAIAWYPMPQRNYQLELNIKYLNSK